MSPELKEALRSYGGPLSAEQIQTLRDMQGYAELGPLADLPGARKAPRLLFAVPSSWFRPT